MLIHRRNMTGLEPRADLAVRQAVDAYIEGRLGRQHAGEVRFETKNSQYRLVNGVLSSAPDGSFLGAEMVGWLLEGGPNPRVDAGCCRALARCSLMRSASTASS